MKRGYAHRGPALPSGWQALARSVLLRDGWRCYLCGEPARQVDHVKPRHLGGTDHPSNLAAICGPCHRSKSAREAGRARQAGR